MVWSLKRSNNSNPIPNPRYDTHKLTHKEYNCDKCGVTVIGNKRWWEHKQEHAGNLSFPCQDCGYVGKFLHNLKAHQREVHTRDEDKQFQCQFCGKVSFLWQLMS